MAGLSLCRDGVALDTLSNTCGVPSLQPPLPCADLEAELKTLADQISKNLPPGSLRSELLYRWVKRFCFQAGGGDGRRSPLCSDLKRRIDAVIHKLLGEGMAGEEDGGADEGGSTDEEEEEEGSRSSSSSWLLATVASLRSKKRKRELEVMLTWLRGAAVAPRDVAENAVEGRKKQLLRARGAMYLSLEEAAEMEGFPYKKKRRSGGLSSEKSQRARRKGTSSTEGTPEERNHLKRRSERLAKNLNINYLNNTTKRIGKGDAFQADVPEWTGPPNERDVSDYKENNSRWLGTQVWLAEEGDRESSQAMVGRGRAESCACSLPGSLACITCHVSEAGLQLRSNLGQAFFTWGFDEMGEEVSKSWENEEQIRFDALEKLNPDAEHSNFWQVASNHFTAKNRRDLVSYYFNVFLLRRVASQSRLTPLKVDSEDDDEEENDKPDDKKKGKTLEGSISRSSRRSRNLKKKS